MSLILEALRKSEADRRRGESADLLTPVLSAPKPAARAWPVAALWGGAVATLVLVAVALVLFWRLREAPESTATVREEGVLAPASVDAGSPVGMPETPAPPVPTPPAPPPPVQPTVTAATAPTTAPAPAPVAPQETASAVAPPSASSATAPTPTAPAPSVPAPPAPTPSAEFIGPEATVRLADLSTEERQQLPALKVSMHMWAPEAAHRFVIIDGTRLAEGDRIADATVSAILADGVTLSWRGRRIRLPIR